MMQRTNVASWVNFLFWKPLASRQQSNAVQGSQMAKLRLLACCRQSTWKRAMIASLRRCLVRRWPTPRFVWRLIGNWVAVLMALVVFLRYCRSYVDKMECKMEIFVSPQTLIIRLEPVWGTNALSERHSHQHQHPHRPYRQKRKNSRQPHQRQLPHFRHR